MFLDEPGLFLDEPGLFLDEPGLLLLESGESCFGLKLIKCLDFEAVSQSDSDSELLLSKSFGSVLSSHIITLKSSTSFLVQRLQFPTLCVV